VPAQLLLEGLGEIALGVRVLKVACVDGAGGIRDRRLQQLRRQEDDRGLENGEEEREERNRDKGELDGRHSVLVAAEGAQATPHAPAGTWA
jgi:hypothetical protein